MMIKNSIHKFQNLGAYMNNHVNDKNWQDFLKYVYEVEKICSNFEQFGHSDRMWTTIDLPSISGVAYDPLISYQMMSKVANLLAEEFPVIVHEDHTHTY